VAIAFIAADLIALQVEPFEPVEEPADADHRIFLVPGVDDPGTVAIAHAEDGAGHMPPYLAGRSLETDAFRRLLTQDTILSNVIRRGFAVVTIVGLVVICKSKRYYRAEAVV
jgi:hypothetical protein